MAKKVIERKSWEEFRTTGLLHFVNHFLHIFGWSIVAEIEPDTNKVINVYPARVVFRGFDEKSTEKAYIALSEYMNKEHKELLKESKGDNENE